MASSPAAPLRERANADGTDTRGFRKRLRSIAARCVLYVGLEYRGRRGKRENRTSERARTRAPIEFCSSPGGFARMSGALYGVRRNAAFIRRKYSRLKFERKVALALERCFFGRRRRPEQLSSLADVRARARA